MGLSITFSVLSDLPSGQAVPYFQAAVLEPYPEIQSRAFEFLESLHRQDIIIQSFTALLPDLRERVLANKRIYFDAARKLVKSRTEPSRRAAYDFLTSLEDLDAAPILALGVSDSSTAIRGMVLGALERIAREYHDHLLRWQSEGDIDSKAHVEEHRGLMTEMLEVLLRTFQIHRKTIFIEIAMEIGEEAHRLITSLILARRDATLQDAFFHVTDKATSPRAIETMFRLLLDSDERMKDYGRAAFLRRKDPAFLSALARYFGTLSRERLLQTAGRVKEVHWWDVLRAARNLGSEEEAEHIRFLAEVSVPPGRKERFLRHFLESSHGRTRALALEAVLDNKCPGALEACRNWLMDPSAETQYAAARGIATLNPPDKVALLMPFLQSNNDDLRKLAMREAGQACFDRFLGSFEALDERTRELAAKAIAKIDASMMDRLSEEVGSLDPSRRLKALQILDYTDMEKTAQPIIRDLLNDPDKKVRATAIKLVQMSGNIAAIRQVIQLLNDPDRRVRANAIEAFEEINDPRFVQILFPFCQDPDNRVRANTVKALWNLGRHEVVEVLFKMLDHKDANMRLSAVWAIGEIQPASGAEMLTQRLSRESDPNVRSKMEEMLARFGKFPGD